jgi:hypothetical protein
MGTRGGLAKVEIRPVTGSGEIRVTVQAYGNLSTATLATMTIEITAGNDTIASTSDWLRKSFGWKNLHD